ncbi:MAG: flagellar hook-length control protein FliK [Pseudomonadota bacterium]
MSTAVARTSADRVEIRLDPPELGRVSLSLNITEQAVSAVISAERPEIGDLMRRHADLLQRGLSEAGYGGVDLEFSQSGGETGRDRRETSSEGPQPSLLEPDRTPKAAGPRDGLDIRL